MKKLTILFLILVAILTGCARESAYQPGGAANVTMTVSDVTPTGAVVTIQDYTNRLQGASRICILSHRARKRHDNGV